jgi:PAS domain S-box-containing protein
VPREKEISSESGRWYVRRILPYRTTDNRIEGVVITFLEITEQRRATAALADSEERLRLAVEAGGVAEWEFDLVIQRLYWSPRLRDLLRIGAEAKADMELLRSLVHPDDRAVRDKVLSEALNPAGNGSYRVDFRIRHPDGSVVWIESRGRAIFSEIDGVRTATIIRGTMMDVSERKLAELALIESKRAAEAANEAKDQFLANVSHELRTPLSALLLWVKLFQDAKTPPQAQFQDGLEAIRRSAEALHELVEDLLDISRISAGKVRLELQPTEVASVVSAAIDAVRPAAEIKGVQIESMLDEGGVMRADPVRLKQIVWNLLSNAVKFTPAGGRVTIAMARHDGEVELCVADTGRGIAPELLPHVFDRFVQANVPGGGPKGGLGLGLAIAKQLVELHGGRISATSAGDGQGATFTVKLPLQPATPPGKPSQNKQGNGANDLADCNILLVEDETNTRTALSALLRARGAKVTAVNSAEAAIRAFSEDRPDVIVCDIGLPSADGNALLRQIRTREAAEKAVLVPAIALTAYACEQDRRRSFESGFQRHVAKPADPDRLVAIIRKVTDRS